MQQNRNYILAIALSVLVLAVWQYFFIAPQMEQMDRERAAQEAVQAEQAAQPPAGSSTPSAQAPQAAPGSGDLPQSTTATTATATTGLPGSGAAASGNISREAALAQTDRILIDTPALTGSINLTGARFDDLGLKNYRETINPTSPIIELLSPAVMKDGYFAEFGYAGNEFSGTVPGPDTVWTVQGTPTLTPANPVVLSWTNDKDIVFQRTIGVDENYMFEIIDAVTNNSTAAVSVSPYGRVTRLYRPETTGLFILHEGLLGVIGDEGVQQIDYGDVEDDRTITPAKGSRGWLGITDKYWATALIPSQVQPFQARFSYFDDKRPRYQTDFLSDPVTIQPGQSQTVEKHLFAGAKLVPLIDSYEESYNIESFELMIDWGWFYFITKPMFYVLDYFFKMFGNFGIAILMTTVILKLFFFPLANKSYVSMANMKKVQPKMEEIKAQFGDDRQAMQQEMMKLYKEEKINPIAGCWPILLQIPVFFALYKVLYITIEMRHAPFFGWIQDLSAPDPTSIFNLFGLIPFDPPTFLMIGVWPLIMGITMFLQMRMNPTPPDPTQAMIFNWMPVVFTFMLATFPAGLVIYWAWNNFLSIIQQGVIMKRQGVKIELWGNLLGMLKKKPKPAE